MTPVVCYVVRSVHWQPMAVATAAGSSLVLVTRAVADNWQPSALLFCLAAMAAAVGSAMDDPASATLAGVPVALWRRKVRAGAVVVVPAAGAWTMLAVAVRELPTSGQLTVMAAGLCTIGLAVAAAAARRLGPTSGGLVAAPTTALVAFGALAAPHGWALAPGLAGMAWRWALIGGVAGALFAGAVRDPARRDPSPRRRAHRDGQMGGRGDVPGWSPVAPDRPRQRRGPFPSRRPSGDPAHARPPSSTRTARTPTRRPVGE